MQKFGIFDLINKLNFQNQPPAKQNSYAKNAQTAPQEMPIDHKKKKSYAYKATLALIKKHDEMSKRIDKNNN